MIIPHFVGASPVSTNLRQTLLSFCSQLNRRIKSTEKVPEDIKELIKIFPALLDNAAEQKKVLLILDAANQFEDADNAHNMQWLPQDLPINVKVVISTLAGKVHDSLLARRDAPSVEQVHGLDEEEIKELVHEYLREIRHEFPGPKVEDAFFTKIRKGNPLYILVALEELRIFGQFKALADRINQLPDDVPALFGQVLKRIESDFNPDLVQDCMSYIACGRQGMTGEELQSLLYCHAPRHDSELCPDKLPDMLWARLFRAFGPYLFERSGVIDFFHGQLKEAVGKRYLKDKEDRNNCHQIIGDYFDTRWQEPYHRAIDELPHQRNKATDFKGLEDVLTDLEFIEAKCAAGMTYGLINDYLVALADADASMPEYRRIETFKAFSQGQSHILNLYPELTFQQAINQPDVSLPFQAAQQLLGASKIERPWVEWKNKPQHKSPCIMTLAGHSKWVNFCAYSPDGSRIVSASEDNTLKVWDAETGAEVATLAGHSEQVASCAFSPDGSRIVSVSEDNTLKVWDVVTGAKITTLAGHSQSVESCDYSPSGSRIVSASVDNILKVWDAGTGAKITTLAGHSGSVTSCAYSPDGSRIVSASEDNTLKVWDAETGAEIATLAGHSNGVTSCAYSPDGSRIVSASEDKTLKVWDAETGSEITTLTGHSYIVHSCAYSPDGSRIVSASWDNTLKLWDAGTGAKIATLAGHLNLGISSAYLPDNNRIVSASYDNILKLWDAETGAIIAAFSGNGSLSTVNFSTSGQIIAGDKGGTIYFLTLKNINFSPPFTTPEKLYRDKEISALCKWCGTRFNPKDKIIDAIRSINSHLSPDQSPCTSLPQEAWDEPILNSECPHCHKPLKLNPFLVEGKKKVISNAGDSKIVELMYRNISNSTTVYHQQEVKYL